MIFQERRIPAKDVLSKTDSESFLSTRHATFQTRYIYFVKCDVLLVYFVKCDVLCHQTRVSCQERRSAAKDVQRFQNPKRCALSKEMYFVSNDMCYISKETNFVSETYVVSKGMYYVITHVSRV